MTFRPISFLRDSLTALGGGGPVWRGGAGDMVLTLYDDGIIVEASAAADDIIGAAGPLQGRSLYDFVQREDRDSVRAALAAAAEGRGCARPAELQCEFRLLRVRRAAALAEIRVAPMGRGRLKALVRTGVEALAPRRAVAAYRKETLKPAAKAPSADLVADLSHEMKTPLNAIMGFADAMRSETFGPLGDDKYKEYADDIHASGAHLMDLIGTILDCAKIDADRYAISPELGDPAPIARDCAAMIRGEAEKAGLVFNLEIAPDLPQTLIDARVVKQILVNLLTNAVKFTKAGSVTLSVSEKCGAIDFVVTDTGVGMSRTAVAKLGGRFSELHQNGVRGAGGAGLGLSLSFALAKLHGGALVFDSSPGEGTTARFTLPLRRALDDAPAAPAMRPGDIQSQLDRVARYRRERASAA